MHLRRVPIRLRAGAVLAALLLGGAALLYGWTSGAARSDVAHRGDNLLRLHVVAHSNDPRDQDVKLKVRDALLSEMAAWGSPTTPDEAESWVLERRERLEAVVSEALRREGFELPVRIDVGAFHFPEKRTNSLFLPAGEYRAIKVVIGDGAGHNWWCVLFPPLCFVEEEGRRVEASGPGTSSEATPAFLVPGDLDLALSSPPDSTGRSKLASGPVESGGSAEAADGETGEAVEEGVKWRMRLWERLSETAYAARLREMIELAWHNLREETF